MSTPDIFSYIKGEESKFETQEIRLGDNWNWSFRTHVQMIFHLKNGVFFTGENDYMRAFKAVMEPLLNLAYWTEDIEVKDVVFFIENAKGRVLSFLIKKYHDEVYTRENDLDMLFDEITESDLDFGGVLVQKTKDVPEVLPLQAIAFCDQTNIEGGPIGFKHHFSPDSLRKMSKSGWGSEKNGATITIDELITLADFEKTPDGVQVSKTNVTTGKTIEVYVVKGDLPEHYLEDNDNMDDWYKQVQIVAFYTDKDSKKHGVTLYRKKEVEDSMYFHTSKKVHNRALGRGVGETLIHPQIWTNFMTIHKTALLEAASKVPLYTDDSSYSNRNKIQDMENLEITTIEDGKKIYQVPTAAPGNIQLMEQDVDDWFQQAQLAGAAQDPLLGKEPASGTTFRGQERTVAQGRGLHDRRRGQRAKFIEKLYREDIIPRIVDEIKSGKKFLASLTVDELSWVSEQLATTEANKKIKEALLNGKPIPSKEERGEIKTIFKEQFSKQGNRKMLEILKGEFKDIEVRMGINVANKQKNLADLSDKLLSIFQFAFANPGAFQQAMQNPALAKAFNNIAEFSGMNEVDFLSLTQPPEQAPAPPQAPPGKAPELALNQPAKV